MTIYNFPAEALAENVYNTELRAALADAPAQTVSCRIGFINTSPVQFLINPQTINYTLNYGGAEHKVQVAFYVNNYSSFGSYDQSKSLLQMQIIEAAVFVDGSQTNYLGSNSFPLLFVSTERE